MLVEYLSSGRLQHRAQHYFMLTPVIFVTIRQEVELWRLAPAIAERGVIFGTAQPPGNSGGMQLGWFRTRRPLPLASLNILFPRSAPTRTR